MPSYLRQQKHPFGSIRTDPHWSVQGLKFFSQFRPAKKVIDESSGKNHGVITAAGGAVWVDNGLELYSNSNDRVQIGPASIASLIKTQGSAGILFDSKSAIAVGSADAPFFINTGAAAYFSLSRGADDVSLNFYCNDVGSSSETFTVPDLWDGQTHFVWVTWDWNLDSSWCYVDGVLVDSETSVLMEAPASQTGSFLNIGGDSLATNTICGVVRAAYIYSRTLTGNEIAEFSRNPDLPMQQYPAWWGKAPAVGVTIPVMIHHYKQVGGL